MKKIFFRLSYWYSLVLISSMVLLGLFHIKIWTDGLIVGLFGLIMLLLVLKHKLESSVVLLLYSLFFLAVVIVANLINIKKLSDILMVMVLVPIFYYFFESFRNRPRAIGQVISCEPTETDNSRRKFLKIATSAGLMSLIMFFLNKKKAQAAFFGSVPGPGTIAVKDSQGNKIDPAASQPLDGYSISNIDTSTDIHYYGFINKNGDWYIIKEDTSSNTLLYARGESGYATSNWLSWAGSQNYDYFNAKFG